MADTPYRKIRLFVAHTSELTAEVDKVREVAHELNKSIADALGVFLEVVEWKTHVMSMMGRPQQVIFDQLPLSTWDIFIGILWLRFGSPTGAVDPGAGTPYASGIEEEFTLAYDLWRNTGRPQVLFFRCTHPTAPSAIDPDELRKINQFFSSFSHAGSHPGLVNTYDTVEAFAQRIQTDLIRILFSYADQQRLKAASTAEAGDLTALKIPVEDGFLGFFVPKSNEERNVRKRTALKLENRLIRLAAQTGFSYLAKVGHRFKEQLVDCLESGGVVQIILLNPWSETGLMIALAESEEKNTEQPVSDVFELSGADAQRRIQHSVYYSQKLGQIRDEYVALRKQFGEQIEVRLTTHDMPATVLMTSTMGFFEPYLPINLKTRLAHHMNTFEVQFGHECYFYQHTSELFNRLWQMSEDYEVFSSKESAWKQAFRATFTRAARSISEQRTRTPRK
jgi:hypothetical protein